MAGKELKAQNRRQVLFQLAASSGKQRRDKWEKEKHVHTEKNASCLSFTNLYEASAFIQKKKVIYKKKNAVEGCRKSISVKPHSV